MVEFEVRSVRYAADDAHDAYDACDGSGVAAKLRRAHIMVSCPECYGVFPVVRSLEAPSFRCSCDYCDIAGQVTLRKPEAG